MKKLLVLFVALLSISAYGQDRKFVSFCDKTGDITMAWDEFSACKKELTSVEPNLKINSFIVSIKISDTYVDYSCKENVISSQALEAIQKAHADKKFEGKILIEEVMIIGMNSERERKVPGMTITIK